MLRYICVSIANKNFYNILNRTNMDDKSKKRLYDVPLSELHTIAKNTQKVASDSFVNNMPSAPVTDRKELTTSATLPAGTDKFRASVEQVRNAK